MTTSTRACFEPSSKIREIREDLFVGKIAELKLGHTNQDKTDQYVSAEHPLFKEYGFWINGWTGRVLGKEGSVIRKKITGFKLVEHRNGGRSWGEYTSYRDFFNDRRKEQVQGYWSGGMLGKILKPGGDPDQADVIISFGDFKIDSFCWDLKAPEEWYSDLHCDEPRFRFVDGFYDSAESAVNAFRQKSHDDIFGTRFFPVVVFPAEKADKAKNIACGAKSCSKPILAGDSIIIGTRCKPYEFDSVIEQTYEEGGRIPIGVEWDWE